MLNLHAQIYLGKNHVIAAIFACLQLKMITCRLIYLASGYMKAGLLLKVMRNVEASLDSWILAGLRPK